MRPLILTLLCAAFGFSGLRAEDWPQWLGPRRDGTSAEVPATLPERKLLWQADMGGESHAGIAVAGGFAVVPDHAPGKDVIHCFSADKGEKIWTHSYPVKAEIQFGSCSRATPLIQGGRVYTLGAEGELCCLELGTAGPGQTAKVLWRKNLAADYKATRPEWGYSASPLLVDGQLVVAPGAADASLAALDPSTGKELWKTPGQPAAYSSFALLTLGGVRQLVGYDKETLGGWDPKTGKRLWTLKPESAGDFNVGTPLAADGHLLVSTENNGARLYAFGKDGAIDSKPLARNDDLSLDMATPILWKNRAYGTRGGLVCLDAAAPALKTLWVNDKEEAFSAYSAVIAGNDRLMVFTEKGTLFLVDLTKPDGAVLGSLALCEKTWSHPALADGRLYIRDAKKLYCYSLK